MSAVAERSQNELAYNNNNNNNNDNNKLGIYSTFKTSLGRTLKNKQKQETWEENITE